MIDVNAYLGHFAFRQLRHNTGAGLVRLMDRFGIRARRGLERSLHYVPQSRRRATKRRPRRWKPHRSRLIPFAVLNPAYAGWQDDLKICHEKFGMKGVRLYPRWHGYALSDPRCRDLVNAAAERQMIDRDPGSRRGSPAARLAGGHSRPGAERDCRADPRLPEGAVHRAERQRGWPGRFWGARTTGSGRTTPSKSRASAWNSATRLGRLLAALGEDRVLFGSGMPFHYPGTAIVRMEILEASDDVKAKIRSRNAERWLNLSAK